MLLFSAGTAATILSRALAPAGTFKMEMHVDNDRRLRAAARLTGRKSGLSESFVFLLRLNLPGGSIPCY